MSDRTVIWFRDAFVLTLVIYVVYSVASAPWSNLKTEDSLSDSCETGCPPRLIFPEDGYYHYNSDLTFNWAPVSVEYQVIFEDENGIAISSDNVTDQTTFMTSKLVAGNYTSFVYFKGIYGSYAAEEYPLLVTDEHDLDSSSKITLIWAAAEMTYDVEIKMEEDSDILPIYHPIVHEAKGLEYTSYQFSDFKPGKTYFWSVTGSTNFTDSVGNQLGFISETSIIRELNIDTTKFLAFELFNNWALPFILLGVLMVIALQAGVFLAREEKDDRSH